MRKINGYFFNDGNFTWICADRYTVYTIANNSGEWGCRVLSKERFMETLAETTGYGEFVLKEEVDE